MALSIAVGEFMTSKLGLTVHRSWQWSWSFSRISLFCTINERPVFTEVKGQIEQYIFIPSNYTLLLQSKPHTRFCFYHRTHHSLPLSCHIRVQIMGQDNDDVRKNKAQPTATFKDGCDSNPWTSKLIYPYFRFALSSYLKSDLIIYLFHSTARNLIQYYGKWSVVGTSYVAATVLGELRLGYPAIFIYYVHRTCYSSLTVFLNWCGGWGRGEAHCKWAKLF
jgi:hypothetical protein